MCSWSRRATTWASQASCFTSRRRAQTPAVNSCRWPRRRSLRRVADTAVPGIPLPFPFPPERQQACDTPCFRALLVTCQAWTPASEKQSSLWQRRFRRVPTTAGVGTVVGGLGRPVRESARFCVASASYAAPCGGECTVASGTSCRQSGCVATRSLQSAGSATCTSNPDPAPSAGVMTAKRSNQGAETNWAWSGAPAPKSTWKWDGGGLGGGGEKWAAVTCRPRGQQPRLVTEPGPGDEQSCCRRHLTQPEAPHTRKPTHVEQRRVCDGSGGAGLGLRTLDHEVCGEQGP